MPQGFGFGTTPALRATPPDSGGEPRFPTSTLGNTPASRWLAEASLLKSAVGAAETPRLFGRDGRHVMREHVSKHHREQSHDDHQQNAVFDREAEQAAFVRGRHSR